MIFMIDADRKQQTKSLKIMMIMKVSVLHKS